MDFRVERVAMAIAKNGFGRKWEDFPECSAHETDQGDLIEYATAAVAEIDEIDAV